MVGVLFILAVFTVMFWIEGGFSDMADFWRWVKGKFIAALQERHDHAVALKYDDVMAIEPEPEGQIKAWTPIEREAFGINETIALIDRIERELNPPPVDSEKLYARGGYVPL